MTRDDPDPKKRNDSLGGVIVKQVSTKDGARRSLAKNPLCPQLVEQVSKSTRADSIDEAVARAVTTLGGGAAVGEGTVALEAKALVVKEMVGKSSTMGEKGVHPKGSTMNQGMGSVLLA